MNSINEKLVKEFLASLTLRQKRQLMLIFSRSIQGTLRDAAEEEVGEEVWFKNSPSLPEYELPPSLTAAELEKRLSKLRSEGNFFCNWYEGDRE